MNVQFAPVHTADEIAQVAALAKEIWCECYVDIISTEQIYYMVQRFQSAGAIAQQIEQEGYSYFLIWADAVPAGYFGLQPKNDALLLSKIYLLRDWRGKGLATKSLRFIEQHAAERGCKRIWLTVNRHNARAIAAYEKYGFATIRTQAADIGDGFIMDDFVMEKPVDYTFGKTSV